MRPYDVAIIGGGVVGTSIARELSRYKLSIAVFEKEEELAFGISKSNSGIIHPGTQNPPDSLKGRLCLQGNRLVRGLAKELGFDFKEVGELIVAFDDEEIERLHKLKTDAEALGVPRLRIVDSIWLRRNEPNLSDKARAALYAPTAGIVSPYRMVYDLSENAVRNGVEIFLSTKVVGIEAKYPFDIFTSRGIFRSIYIVNAAGLFSDEVAGMVGVRDFRIRPRKGEEFLLDKKKEHIANHLLFPLPNKLSKGVLVIKTSDGNPMIGPTAEDINAKEDLSTSDEGLEKVLSSAQRLMPSISKDDIIAYFAGLRPSAGRDFIIRHEKRVPGVISVAGIQSPGLTAAPAIAVMVRNILKKTGLEMNKKMFFRSHRNKTTHLFAMPLARMKRLIKGDPSYGDIVCRCEMVSAKEINDAADRGATTLDGIKFRTRAQAGRCHGSFCTTRIMKILSEKMGKPLESITKKGRGSEVIVEKRRNG